MLPTTEYDECQTKDHGCQHICVNTIGGYRCECKIGYELNPDGRTCEGLIHTGRFSLTQPSPANPRRCSQFTEISVLHVKKRHNSNSNTVPAPVMSQINLFGRINM